MCWFFWDVLVSWDVLVFLGCVGFPGMCWFFWMCWFFGDVLVFLGCVGFPGMCWFFWMCWFFGDVLVFLDAMIFCNNFARWLQKIVATCDVLVFLGCVGFL
jgi:hypothetical protein